MTDRVASLAALRTEWKRLTRERLSDADGGRESTDFFVERLLTELEARGVQYAPREHGPECPQRPPRLVHELTGEPVLPCDCGAAPPREPRT